MASATTDTTIAKIGNELEVLSVREIPSVLEIKTWVSQFYKKNQHHWDVHNFIKPEIIDWFLGTQRDAWVKSGRPFTTFQELVFGVPNPCDTMQTRLAYGLHYYYSHKFGTTDWHRESTFWKNRAIPDMPETYNQDVCRYFPGMPSHFIAVCHNYFLEIGARFSAFPFIQMACNAMLAFLMICCRADLPNEIVHQILMHLRINTYTGRSTNGADIKFLGSGADFKNAMVFFNRVPSIKQKDGDIRWYDITQMTNAFWPSDV